MTKAKNMISQQQLTQEHSKQYVVQREQRYMKITLHPNINNITLSDASGNPMPVTGVAHLYVIPKGGIIPKFIEMAVTSSMGMDILISPTDQKNLPSFPPATLNTAINGMPMK